MRTSILRDAFLFVKKLLNEAVQQFRAGVTRFFKYADLREAREV